MKYLIAISKQRDLATPTNKDPLPHFTVATNVPSVKSATGVGFANTCGRIEEMSMFMKYAYYITNNSSTRAQLSVNFVRLN